MARLIDLLRDTDIAMLRALAQVWGVNFANLNQEDLALLLAEAMQEPARAAAVWGRLTDDQRGKLLMVASGGSTLLALFEKIAGKLVKRGRAQIEKELPHLQPQTDTDALYYRGLVWLGYDQRPGMPAIVFIPPELLQVLPLHQNSYADIAAEVAQGDPAERERLAPLGDAVENVRRADTTLVDDMTTLLAWMRVQGAGVEGDVLLPAELELMQPQMLNPHPARLNFMLGIAYSGDFLSIEEGRASYKRGPAGEYWLNLARHDQVRQLAEVWRSSDAYQEMWHTPNLYPEINGLDGYLPAPARANLLALLAAAVPAEAWWDLDDFVEMVREQAPDFQRPGGDFDRWYIRDESSAYLIGLDSWDEVEAQVIEFIVNGPLHWLGLLDVADRAARLTAYGRAFLGLSAWPEPKDQADRVALAEDGALLVSRRVPRRDRFQVARFSTWAAPVDEMYRYIIDASGLRRATVQGIEPKQVAAFLRRALEPATLPPIVEHLLETWQPAASHAMTLEALWVLRATAPQVIDDIFNDPSLRRFLGARLGPMAVAVQAERAEELRSALEQRGIEVDLRR